MQHNSSIGCSVAECQYHCKQDDFCTLDKIQVVKNSGMATMVEHTDCGSFKKS